MLSSLPARPLTLPEVTALDQNAADTFCRPILALASETPIEDIIACYLATDATATLVAYADTGGWTIIDRFDDGPDLGDFDRSSTAILDWADRTYGADNVVVISDDESADSLVHLLPEHPIGKADLPTLETLPGIDHVHPIFCDAETHEIIAILSFQTDPIDPAALSMVNYAYHPTQQSWKEIERAAIDSDRDLVPDEDLTIHEWLKDHYNMDNLQAISPKPLD